MAGRRIMCPPQQPRSPLLHGRSRSLHLQQSQSFRFSQRWFSFPYNQGLDSSNLKEGSHDENRDYYKQQRQTTVADDSNPRVPLLNTDYKELGNVAIAVVLHDSNPRESPHAGSDYDEPDTVARIVGSDNSNLVESLLPCSTPPSDIGDEERSSLATEVSPSGSNRSEFVAVNIVSHDGRTIMDQGSRGTVLERLEQLDRIFIITGLSLESLSAGFDQASSPAKPHYALVSLLLAIAAVLTCICELIHNGINKGLPSRQSRDFRTLPDIFGFGLAVIQCVCSAVQYYFLHRHANNPMKLSPVPLFFFCCLVVLKLKVN